MFPRRSSDHRVSERCLVVWSRKLPAFVDHQQFVPVSYPIACCRARFRPHKMRDVLFEAPRRRNTHAAFQHRCGRPHEQQRVVCKPFLYRQRAYFRIGHARIMTHRTDTGQEATQNAGAVPEYVVAAVALSHSANALFLPQAIEFHSDPDHNRSDDDYNRKFTHQRPPTSCLRTYSLEFFRPCRPCKFRPEWATNQEKQHISAVYLLVRSIL